MTVSADQIKAAQAKGLINVEPLAVACDKLKFPFHLACAILDKETDGRNIFGHDKGGAFSDPDGKDIEVTEGRYKEFLKLIGAGKTSNGVGPMQLTYKGYHIGPVSLQAKGLKAWVPADNILYGVEILAKSYQANLAKGMKPEAAFWATAKAYNGNASYADDAVVKARTWAATVGSSDMEVPVATERLQPPFDTQNGLTCIDVLRALPLVEYRFKLKGWIKKDFSGLISQWGYRNNAIDASSTTHNRGGDFDVDFSLVDTDEKLVVWQQCGFAPFRRRKPQWSLSVHGHICVIGCDHLDPMAADQVTDYHHGRNGLASHAAYDGPIKADRTWQDAQRVYAALVEDMNMPTAKEIVDEMIKQGPKLGAAIAKGFLSADDIIASGADEPHPDTNKFQAPKTFITGDHDLLVDIRDALKKLTPPPA